MLCLTHSHRLYVFAPLCDVPGVLQHHRALRTLRQVSEVGAELDRFSAGQLSHLYGHALFGLGTVTSTEPSRASALLARQHWKV